MKPLPYERFAAWRHAHQLVLATYQLTLGFPVDERFGLVSQGRRAAFSVAANIAEGSAKKGTGEFRRFVDISLGSLSELAYIFRLAHELGYISLKQWEATEDLRAETGRTTWGLYRTLK
jgi:four helix bundle protein